MYHAVVLRRYAPGWLVGYFFWHGLLGSHWLRPFWWLATSVRYGAVGEDVEKVVAFLNSNMDGEHQRGLLLYVDPSLLPAKQCPTQATKQ